jgi:hypothetical protein
MPRKVIAFNANGIRKQRFELRKQHQDQRIDMALLWETFLTPHERFFIPNYHVYRTERHPGLKGGTAFAVKKVSPILM